MGGYEFFHVHGVTPLLPKKLLIMSLEVREGPLEWYKLGSESQELPLLGFSPPPPRGLHGCWTLVPCLFQLWGVQVCVAGGVSVPIAISPDAAVGIPRIDTAIKRG